MNEVVDINGSKVYVDNGQVKVELSERIRTDGYMTVEEAREITHEIVRQEYSIK